MNKIYWNLIYWFWFSETNFLSTILRSFIPFISYTRHTFIFIIFFVVFLAYFIFLCFINKKSSLLCFFFLFWFIIFHFSPSFLSFSIFHVLALPCSNISSDKNQMTPHTHIYTHKIKNTSVYTLFTVFLIIVVVDKLTHTRYFKTD